MAGSQEIEQQERAQLRPVGDRLLVRPIAPEVLSKGGIYIPDQAQGMPLVGIVVAAGPGRHSETGHLIPMEVAAGQKVFYNKFAGTVVKVRGDEETLIMMSVDDVLAVYEPQQLNCTCPAHSAPQRAAVG